MIRLCDESEFDTMVELISEAHAARGDALRHAFETKLKALNARNASPREIMSESERLRQEYEQD